MAEFSVKRVILVIGGIVVALVLFLANAPKEIIVGAPPGALYAQSQDESSHHEDHPSSSSSSVGQSPPHLSTAKKIFPSSRYARRVTFQKYCKDLKEYRGYLVSIPSDIGELLPFLEAYTDEVEVAAEAGSRAAVSSACMLNRHNAQYASLELIVLQPLVGVHANRHQCAISNPAVQKFANEAASLAVLDSTKNDEGNPNAEQPPIDVSERRHVSDPSAKNFIVKGDDVKMGLPWPKVEFLFIDTLHSAQQLYMEMEVFPEKVTKYIAFHDTFSFYSANEAHMKRDDAPEHVKAWSGLHVVVKEFLKKHGDEWVEDMSYTHNNGFLVIRRKSFQPKVRAPNPQVVQTLVDISAEAGIKTVADVAKFVQENNKKSPDLEPLCKAVYNRISGDSSQGPCFTWPPKIHIPGPIRQTIAALRNSDDIPLFDKAMLPLGYAMQEQTDRIAILLSSGPASSSGNVEEQTERMVEYVMLLSAAAGALRSRKLVTAICPEPKYCGADVEGSVLNLLKKHTSVFETLQVRTHLKAGVYEPKVLFVTGPTYEEMRTAGAAKVKEVLEGIKPTRVYVHGTVLGDATHVPKGYNLRTCLHEGVGVAVFEKDDDWTMHYVKELS